ncbi:hypothetical protein, partial [Moorena sp. SIO3I6]|uniref:hypothetical protein n=1 Tax=Moorena sp. SIO3I6 TaxID=2607831 RepID=UPI00260119FA
LLSYPGHRPRGARSVRGKVTPRSITVAHGCAWESPSLRRVGRNYRYIISYQNFLKFENPRAFSRGMKKRDWIYPVVSSI